MLYCQTCNERVNSVSIEYITWYEYTNCFCSECLTMLGFKPLFLEDEKVGVKEANNGL
jgi:hypothetical protein